MMLSTILSPVLLFWTSYAVLREFQSNIGQSYLHLVEASMVYNPIKFISGSTPTCMVIMAVGPLSLHGYFSSRIRNSYARTVADPETSETIFTGQEAPPPLDPLT